MRVLCALALVALSAREAWPQEPASPAPPEPSPAASTIPSPESVDSPSPSPPPTPPPQLTSEQIRHRERMALISLSTVVQAQESYAAMNHGLFDTMECLTRPAECIPAQKEATPVLDPGYHWLQPRLGYAMTFHPGPSAPDASARGASASSLTAYAVTVTPEHPGKTGGRAFCADATGRMCFTPGAAPPVKDGRCEPCKKLQ